MIATVIHATKIIVAALLFIVSGTVVVSNIRDIRYKTSIGKPHPFTSEDIVVIVFCSIAALVQIANVLDYIRG